MKYIVVLLLAATIVTAQQNLLNGNFEDTTITHINSEADTNARHWTMSTFGAAMTDDAYSGSSAVYIWNWYYYAHGELTNGNAELPATGGTLINFSPTQLTGYYKYIAGDVDTENDSAVAEVYLTRYNPVSSLRDTIASGKKKLGFIGDYTVFNVEIDYRSSLAPDTALVKFISSENGFCLNSSGGNCLFLYLDDVELSNSTTGLRDEVKFENTLSIFPNPSTETIRITAMEFSEEENAVVHIYNLSGREILQQSFVSGSSIDISALPCGGYLVQVNEMKGKFIKE